jgi:hypothetical protein
LKNVHCKFSISNFRGLTSDFRLPASGCSKQFSVVTLGGFKLYWRSEAVSQIHWRLLRFKKWLM